MIADVAETTGSGLSLIEQVLNEQSNLTAVERFAQAHEQEAVSSQTHVYRDLIPLEVPRGDEQYAFEVDLDACSGCKACVTACHNLNGLEETEVWRSVGLLSGGSTELPVLQHVTAACHHCIEPACLHGCPVDAYEKDPLTGIVRHLDDQCIGCKYCIFKCPYDVPKYSKDKGIVRKCDMCSDRLSAGEAPACVQACPNQAIRITVVDKHETIEHCEANQFVPGAAEPSYTLPTTVYKSQRPLPRNLLPADYFSAKTEHAHLPLVVMLVLTQMSVGTFVAALALMRFFGADAARLLSAERALHFVAALLLGFLGLGASIFHLGRPFYAFRAFIGLRRSWLSREILAFTIFAGTAAVYAAVSSLEFFDLTMSSWLARAAGAAAAVSGLFAVFCSVMVYVDTQRPFWNFRNTTVRFFGSTVLLGVPTALLISLVGAAFTDEVNAQQMMSAYGRVLCQVTMAVCLAKLVWETSAFAALKHRRNSPAKQTATLLAGELGLTTVKRFLLSGAGGLLLPLILLNEPAMAAGGFSQLFVIAAVTISVVLLLIGELFERYLFFTAVVAPSMPGAPS